VALAHLRDSRGHLIAAPGWFERLRDSRKLLRVERSRRRRYVRIFAALKRAGISKRHLYEAWDFTIASHPDPRNARCSASESDFLTGNGAWSTLRKSPCRTSVYAP
jgi:predicted nucleic acid-binding protein